MNYKTRKWVDLHLVDAMEEKWANQGLSESAAIRYRLRNTGIRMVSHYCWDIPSLQRVISNIVSYRFTYRWPRHAIPYLHIASHGSPDGLTVGNKTEASWSDLSECLLPLQQRIDFTLPISLSSCWGFEGYQLASQTMTSYEKKRAFHTLVGPQEGLSSWELFNAWGAFYNCLLHEFGPLEKAVALANAEIADPKAYLKSAK
jgi:hypothetical protein